MSQSRKKGADEIFCRSCGEAIKQKAEICPHCGVRNNNTNSNIQKSTTRATTHDPSQYETTVADSWWYGVAGGTALWALVFVLAAGAGDSIGAFGGLLALVAWVGLPLAAYFDMQYVRANSKWNPNTIFWVIFLAIWLVNIVAGGVYLYRRREVLGEP